MIFTHKTLEKKIISEERSSTDVAYLKPFNNNFDNDAWTKQETSPSYQYRFIPETDDLFEQIGRIADSAWTKQETSPSYQDRPVPATDLNIHSILISQNPVLEIENDIIDIIRIDLEDESDDDLYEINLYRIIDQYNALALMAISNLLDSEKIIFLQAVKLLSFIGKIRHLPTFYYRTWLLVKNLNARSKYVRDGASLGLLYLENPSTINSLKNAIDREPSKQLKQNMIQVLNALEKKS